MVIEKFCSECGHGAIHHYDFVGKCGKKDCKCKGASKKVAPLHEQFNFNSGPGTYEAAKQAHAEEEAFVNSGSFDVASVLSREAKKFKKAKEDKPQSLWVSTAQPEPVTLKVAKPKAKRQPAKKKAAKKGKSR